MYKWKIQQRFVSDRHISEWQTIAYSKTRKGAENQLQMFNSTKLDDIEYRMIPA